MTDALRDIVGDNDISESLDTLVAKSLANARLGSLGLSVHFRKVAIQTRKCNSEAWKTKNRGFFFI